MPSSRMVASHQGPWLRDEDQGLDKGRTPSCGQTLPRSRGGILGALMVLGMYRRTCGDYVVHNSMLHGSVVRDW